MANFIQRDKNRRKLILKYELKRVEYRSLIKDLSVPREIKKIYVEKLNKLPRNSSYVRSRNRCILTGRSRAVFRFCKLSRIALRDLASQGMITGMTKSSW
jgi:ribosomal protein S14